MPEGHHLQIKVLGELEVTRSDGTRVAPQAWRTGKTRDLVRLLALDCGRPVQPETLIGKLWPDACPQRARGSLRTASSQIRQAIGTGCVHRRPDGLILEGASVDAVTFRWAATRVSRAAAGGRDEEVLEAARHADPLYEQDFRAHANDSDWARTVREELRRARLELLCDAARSALRLRRAREALYFAERATSADPTSELAHRLLMRALAADGEVGRALHVFETYRSRLATDLGADPSPQTRELHLQLLRGVAV